MENSKEEELVGQLRRATDIKERRQAVEALQVYCINDLKKYSQRWKDRVGNDELKHLIHQSLADLVELLIENRVILNSSLKAYVVGILRNKLSNYTRTVDKWNKHKEDIMIWLASYSQSLNAEELIIRKEVYEEKIKLVNNTLAKLSDNCRKYFQLWMNGLNNTEIAEELDLKVGSIKVIGFRCRQNFKKKMRA